MSATQPPQRRVVSLNPIASSPPGDHVLGRYQRCWRTPFIGAIFFEAVETRKMRKHVIQDPGDPLIPDRPG